MIDNLKGTLTSAVFVIVVLLFLSFLVITPMLSMIVLAAVFAYAVRPIAKRLQPYLKFHSLAITVGMVVVILPLIAILFYSIESIAQSAPSLVAAAESINISNITSTSIQNSQQFQQHIPTGVYPYLGSISGVFEAAFSDIVSRITSYLVGLLQSLPNVALELFVFFVATFYLARDGDKLWTYVDFFIPQDKKGFFDNLFREVDNVLKSIFFGHFLSAIIVGLISGIGFYLLGYPYSLFLGILTGFCQVMPFVGHWPTYSVVAIYDIINGNFMRLSIVVILSIALSVLDMYLRPHISGKYADIHPMIFLLGFICGPLLLGLVGFIIGPLVLGVAYAAVLAYKESKDIEKGNDVDK